MNEADKMLETLEVYLATTTDPSEVVRAYNAAVFGMFRLEKFAEAQKLANRMVRNP